MKKSSKNNHSKKNSNQYKKDSNSSFYSKNSSSSKKNNRFLNNSSKNKSVYNLNDNDKNKSSISFLKREKSNNNYNKEEKNKSPNLYQEQLNKRNFDDWIWGKHSVYEALINERAINRIWCTSEIFSSEKFYILLKNLKSKGVLIEEVSWNRLAQLTFGASHQGVALQLACSKTISLEKLIDLSKRTLQIPLL